MAALIPQKMFDEQLAAMDIENFAQATIRQVGAVGGALEKNSGTEFLHLEMGVPGLPPETVGGRADALFLHASRRSRADLWRAGEIRCDLHRHRGVISARRIADDEELLAPARKLAPNALYRAGHVPRQ